MFDVTPYYLLRSAVDGGDEWNYWDVGVQRAWALCEGLTFTARFYGELGDGRLFESGEVLQTFLQPSGRNLFEVVWHLDDWEMFGSLSGIDVLESP